MASIPKAYHRLEHRIMAISEYVSYQRAHPHWHSIRTLRCIECGDEITFCSGDIKGDYFKHNPSSTGHGYCSLYHEGKASFTKEAIVRKKLFSDENISLNFEIRMVSGKWGSLLTIPAFSEQEIIENEKNKTIMRIEYSSSIKPIILPIDKEHFSPGELKKLGLDGFPSYFDFSITGNGAMHRIAYHMIGFEPTKQLYTTLIKQDYSVEGRGTIDLSRLKSFSCKKIAERVYKGRHYLFFVHRYAGFENNFSNEEAVVKQVLLPNDGTFNFLLYDVIFKKVTSKTEIFCDARDCELIERNDATIIWPPVNSIGNYKYFRNQNTEMFLAFENDNETSSLLTHRTSDLFFKIQNINSNSFYVTSAERVATTKTDFHQKEIEAVNISLDPIKSNYLFRGNVLIQKLADKKYKLAKKEYVLSIDTRLDYEIFCYKGGAYSFNNENVLALIRYSQVYIKFDKNRYDYLTSIYGKNSFISEYLDLCLAKGRIKKRVEEYLMEGKL